MNSALAIKTKDYYAVQRWAPDCSLAHIPQYSKQPTDVLH